MLNKFFKKVKGFIKSQFRYEETMDAFRILGHTQLLFVFVVFPLVGFVFNVGDLSTKAVGNLINSMVLFYGFYLGGKLF